MTDATQLKVCPSCGKSADAEDDFCAYCGSPIPEQTIEQKSGTQDYSQNQMPQQCCVSCGSIISDMDSFCAKCGGLVNPGLQQVNNTDENPNPPSIPTHTIVYVEPPPAFASDLPDWSIEPPPVAVIKRNAQS